MDLYLIFTVILLIVLASRGYQQFKHKGKSVFENEGQFVMVYPTKELRFSFVQSIKIQRETIKTIQIADTCISLFTHSGNATDVWIRKKYLKAAVINVRDAFPNAEFVEVGR